MNLPIARPIPNARQERLYRTSWAFGHRVDRSQDAWWPRSCERKDTSATLIGEPSSKGITGSGPTLATTHLPGVGQIVFDVPFVVMGVLAPCSARSR